MKHRHNSAYEKPLHECPQSCSLCPDYKNELCTANGFRSYTTGLSDPKDRPVPFPLNCYWWYANRIWDKLPHTKITEYKEERLHLFVADTMLDRMPNGDKRNEFIKHYFRPGGGKIIDFKKYPEAQTLYEFFKLADEEITPNT